MQPQGIPVLRSRSGINPASFGNLLFQGQSLSPRQFISKTGNQTRPVQQGRAYLFDGSDDHVNFGNLNAQIGQGNMTVLCWIRPTDVTKNYAMIATKADGGPVNGNFELRQAVVDGSFQFYFLEQTTGSLKSTFSASVLVNNTWAHVGGRYNGAKIDTIFNGVQNSTASATGVRSATASTPVMAGSHNSGTVFNFGGSMYDLRIWNVALTDAEIAQVYAGDLNVRTSDLVVFAKMDEQAGTVSYDSSGNGNNGTITNATLGTFHSTQTAYSYQNQVGYNLTGGVYIPRNEASIANDVLGNPLLFSGKAKMNAILKGSNCILLNGTDQSGTLGNIGNINRFRGYVRLAVDNQTILSLANTTATAFSVSGAVLTAGASLTLGVIKIGTNEDDLVTVTASEAGIALNLNATLFIEINFTTFNATDVRLGLANTTFGNVNFAGVTTSLAGVAVSNNPISEGFGSTSYDISGNARDVSWVNAPTWSTQDVFHNNIRLGFNKYMAFDRVDDTVTFDIPSLTTYTNATVEMDVNVPTTQTAGIFIRAGSGAYLLSWDTSSATINTDSGSPIVTVDGVLVTTRNSMLNAIATGTKKRIRVTNVNFALWTSNTVVIGAVSSNAYNINAIIENITVDLTSDGIVDHRWTGFGNTNADWVGRVGSVNGVVAGSPISQRIPLIGAVDAGGFTARNLPIIGHNDAETAIDFKNITELGNVPPEMQHLAVSVNFTAFTFGLDTGWDTYAYAFYRQFSSTANDRFLIYASALTGINLAKAQKYTNN